MKLLHMLRRAIGHVRRQQSWKHLCTLSGLNLNYNLNWDSINVLKEIFYNRCYADYFPFYQVANILDVGAHKGYFSLFAAMHTAPDSRIIALEPYEVNYQAIVANLKANSITTVTAVKAGLAAESGTAELFLSRSCNHSVLSQYPKIIGNNEKHQSVMINVYSLKSLLDRYRIDCIDFMKLDCEGGEYSILFETDSETLSRIRTLSMEFHDTKDPRFTGLTMIEFLQAKGFSITHFCHSPTTRNINYGKIIAIRH